MADRHIIIYDRIHKTTEYCHDMWMIESMEGRK